MDDRIYAGEIECPACHTRLSSYVTVLTRDSAGMPTECSSYREASCCIGKLRLPLLANKHLVEGTNA
jgi:hypothetical protein